MQRKSNIEPSPVYFKEWRYEFSDCTEWIKSIEIKESLIKRTVAGTSYFYTLSTFIGDKKEPAPYKIIFKLFKSI